jgi:hypothetical protein
LVHDLPDAVTSGGTVAMLEYVRRRQGCRQPLEIHVSPRHIVLDLDHGLGDGRFALELTAALFAHLSDRSSPWVNTDDTPLALPRALFHTFGRHPDRVLMVWRYVAGLRRDNTIGQGAASSESVPWSPSSAVTVAHVDADAESAVDEWRRVHAQKSGSAAMWLYIVRQALRAAGVRMTDRVIFAFDCRRYLPKGCTANANFIIGLDVSVPVDEALPTVVGRLRELADSGVPLAGMAAVSARAVRRARRAPAMPTNRRVDALADVMYSDMGRITLLDGAPWRGEVDPMATGLLDPAGPSSITVLNSRIGSTRDIAFSFHDNVVDRRVVDEAAEYLKNPVQFLAS